MNTKNQDSKQQDQHGHQNQEPKKGQNPSDPQNRQNDPKYNQLQEKGRQHEREEQTTR